MVYNIFMRRMTLSFLFSRRGAASALVLLAILAVCLALGTNQTHAPASLEGGEVAALTDRGYFPEVSALLASANKSIHVIMYSVNYYPDYPGSGVNLLIEEMETAAKNGLDVRVLADEEATDKPVVSILKERGINAKFDSAATRTHAKLIIIDSKIIIIGSTNWSYSALDQNHEASAVINSAPLAGQFEAYFEKVWAES